ncbi:hypothetical protein [uncultured Ruegeria sp.]|uniref:hypothetical protein n=1 Tax=uncultured Ruegeria sp. TaxID=259304 RepID=UPI0026280736|nr:hypothetical protein [uncultured Ruegeria sp.]
MTDAPSLLARGPRILFQPTDPHQPESDIEKRLAFLVGLVAFGLPVILAAGSIFGGSCFRDSISHFYYAQFLGPIFVGLLYFIGGFLVAYTGEMFIEDRLSTVAGVGAFIVASVPTLGTGCEGRDKFLSRVFVEVTNGDPITVTEASDQEFFNLFSTASNWHLVAAGILFIYLALYCLFVLKRVVPERHERNGVMIESKRQRNQLYSICGLIILACVALLFFKGKIGGPGFLIWWDSLNLTFFVEAIALWAFGIAWFAKSRVFQKLNDS